MNTLYNIYLFIALDFTLCIFILIFSLRVSFLSSDNGQIIKIIICFAVYYYVCMFCIYNMYLNHM